MIYTIDPVTGELVARDAIASFFGDADDVRSGGDNGIGAWGFRYVDHPEFLGVALPIQTGGELGDFASRFVGYNGNNLSSATKVRIFSRRTRREAVGVLVDKGPSSPGRAVDLLIGMVNALDLDKEAGLFHVDVRILDSSSPTITPSDSDSAALSDSSNRLSDRVPIPPRSAMNTGLSSARESTMLNLLGIPGPKTEDCSNDQARASLRARLTTRDVGPFTVTGLRPAVESLQDIFDEVRTARPDLYEAVKNEGMLCIRHIRGNPTVYSNHAWGTAIDLYFGDDSVVPRGDTTCHRGVLALYPYFHRHGWYWGAEFPTPDSMHFELAEETIRTYLQDS